MRRDTDENERENEKLREALARQDAVFEDREWAPVALAAEREPGELAAAA